LLRGACRGVVLQRAWRTARAQRRLLEAVCLRLRAEPTRLGQPGVLATLPHRAEVLRTGHRRTRGGHRDLRDGPAEVYRGRLDDVPCGIILQPDVVPVRGAGAEGRTRSPRAVVPPRRGERPGRDDATPEWRVPGRPLRRRPPILRANRTARGDDRRPGPD